MNTGFGGVAETLSLDLGGRRLQVVLERRGPATGAPTWLLLPALSTVSSRSEWQPLATAVADRCQLVSFDWPGFGDSDRPPCISKEVRSYQRNHQGVQPMNNETDLRRQISW